MKDGKRHALGTCATMMLQTLIVGYISPQICDLSCRLRHWEANVALELLCLGNLTPEIGSNAGIVEHDCD